MRRALAGFGACAALVAGGLLPASQASAAAPTSQPVPIITPTPQRIEAVNRAAHLPGTVRVQTTSNTDPAARAALVAILESHGVDNVWVSAPGRPDARRAPLTITLGAAGDPQVDDALAVSGLTTPDQAEGYALSVDGDPRRSVVVLAGHDGAGQFYAVQTLRQLVQPRGDDSYQLAGAQVVDYPSMPLRGTIEGFYGQPWTQAERLDQMDFYGDVKANTYIYAPKDDPYHRDQWRDPYPVDKLAELGELVSRADANHVQFTFAVSPGQSICFSSATDRALLEAKLQALYDLGTRTFSLPLDDISYGTWNCDGDAVAYGAPGPAAAAQAQVDLLNDVQRTWIATHDGARPLQMVPTEYGDVTDTSYKQYIRTTLDPVVQVMWTGTDVIPPSITNEQAQQSAALFGRKVFVWDNYPVNDYGSTSGRLLLAPYDKREAGLSSFLSGIVANPMNQPYASKIAVSGAADFAWNDAGYDAARSWKQSFAYLAGGDAKSADALEVFADLEHLAPSFGPPWQPQAPVLQARVKEFWTAFDGGDRTQAVADLRTYATAIAAAPATIRAGSVQDGFATDAAPWLDATALWGQAMVATLDALSARLEGDALQAAALADQSVALQDQAGAVRVVPARNRWGEAPVKVADGVLDTFLFEAGLRLEFWDAADGASSLAGVASASSVEQDLDRLAPRFVNDADIGTRWSSGYTDDEWVQIELAAPAVVRAVTLSWEASCATEYQVQTSTDGATWETRETVKPASCGTDVVRLVGDEPVKFVRMQGVQRSSSWGYSIFELAAYGVTV